MNRINVNPDGKQEISDIFTLTNVVTNESLAFIPSDSEGNFNYRGISKTPLQRNAMQTSQTSGEWSDLEYPWMAIPQEDWTGGRGNLRFTTDKSRFYDSYRCQSAFNACIFNAPLDHYSEGFRQNIFTNYPGNVHWKKLKEGMLSVEVTDGDSLLAGECRILLRRRGTPPTGLTVGLGSEGENVESVTVTADDITDTISKFYRVTFSNETISASWLNISSTGGTSADYWEIGVNDDNEPYYRLSPVQDGYRSIFFEYEQLMFMIRQLPNGTPTLWMNGDIGNCNTVFPSISANAVQNCEIDEETGKGYNGQYKETALGEWIDFPYGYYAQFSRWSDTWAWNGQPLQKEAKSNELYAKDKEWIPDQWKGARIGLVYGKGIEGQCSVWRTITGNTEDLITVDEPWDVQPDTGCTFIIVDTPIWTQIETELLTTAVTDIEVVHGFVYICQGDYTPYIVMWWDFNTGTFLFRNDYYQTGVVDTSGDTDIPEVIETESLKATYIKAVRDSAGLMLWRARNDAVTYEIHNTAEEGDEPVYEIIQGKEHNRVIDKSYLIDRNVLVGYDEEEDPPAEINYSWTKKNLAPSAGRVILECTYPGLDGTSTRTADYADFYYPDIDFKQYKIIVGKYENPNLTGTLTITLQESPDLYDWKDVKSITCGCAGYFYLHAHCQHRYRRIIASTSNVNARSIEITMGTSPVFETAFILRDNYGKITNLHEYGSEQEKFLWIFQEGMVSSVNKTGDSYSLDRLNLDELETTSDEWNASAIGTSDVYLQFAWLNGLQRYYNTQLEGKGPDHDEGLPKELRGRITAIQQYPSNFFISIDGGDNGYSSVLMHNGSGWHNIYTASNKGEKIFDIKFQPIYGDRPDRLWIQLGDDVIWLTMPSKILYALQDANAEFTHESVLVSAWITGGMAEVRKLWQSLSIIADHLEPGGCWIEADYQLDNENNPWVPIPTNPYTESPQEEKVLAASNESVNGYSLRYRLRLQTTDIHKTPKVNVVLLKAIGIIDIKYSYGFSFRNIKYKPDLTGEYEELEPYEMDVILDKWSRELSTLILHSAYKLFDNKRVFLEAPQTSVLTEKKEGYLQQITLTEI